MTDVMILVALGATLGVPWSWAVDVLAEHLRRVST